MKLSYEIALPDCRAKKMQHEHGMEQFPGSLTAARRAIRTVRALLDTP
jgi:hypothetical protein